MSGSLDRALRRRSHREAGRSGNRTSGASGRSRGWRPSHGHSSSSTGRGKARSSGVLGLLLLILLGLIALFAYGMGCSFTGGSGRSWQKIE